MSNYDNTNRGALFLNDKKERDNHPDYKGSVDADGTGYWVSAWVKVSQRGDEYLSIALTPKEDAGRQAPSHGAGGARRLGGGPQQQQAGASQPSRPRQPTTYQEPPMDFDDDIPF